MGADHSKIFLEIYPVFYVFSPMYVNFRILGFRSGTISLTLFEKGPHPNSNIQVEKGPHPNST